MITDIPKCSRGLFLDLDGTLADSLGPLRKAYEVFLISFGKHPCAEEFQNLNGPPLVEIVTLLKARHDLPGDVETLQGLYLARIDDAHKQAPLAQGACELVMSAVRGGWAVTVVTSAHKASARTWLEHNGILGVITDVIGGDEVTHGKPSPEPYVLALSRTNCDPRLSMAVEDSRIGAASASSAGLRTFALADGNDREDWPTNVTFLNNLSEMLGRL